jgi:hypothetical protein
MLSSSFTGSRPATLLVSDDFSSSDSRESSTGDLSGGTLAEDSDGETLVDSDSDSKVLTAGPQAICYGGIDFLICFLHVR